MSKYKVVSVSSNIGNTNQETQESKTFTSPRSVPGTFSIHWPKPSTWELYPCTSGIYTEQRQYYSLSWYNSWQWNASTIMEKETSWPSKSRKNKLAINQYSSVTFIHENANSVAPFHNSPFQDHGTKTVNYLNPGQIPVLTMDQPMYAIAK